MAVVPGSPAEAAVFTVNSTADAVDVTPGDGVCETAPANGVCTLRAAIQETNALAGADTIILPAGTYTLTIPGAVDQLAATGDLDILDSLTISGAGAAATVIQACSVPPPDPSCGDRVFEIVGTPAGITVAVSGVTIRHGSASGVGGGIRADSGTVMLTLTDVVVTTNRVTGNGGGVGIGSTTTLVLMDSTVSNNEAAGNGFAGGGLQLFGPTTITRSTVSGNTAPGNSVGGGISSVNASLQISASTISGNTALSGGGIRILRSSPAPATITNSTISGNSARTDGGGMFVSFSPGTALDLNNVTIAGNTADSDASGTGNGGGINLLGGTVTLKNTILAGNVDLGGQAPDCNVGAGQAVTSQGYNLIGTTAGCTIVGDATGNITGVAANLAPLADNGGLTRTHAPCAGAGDPDPACPAASPAIEAGNPAAPGSGGTACEATDQRGAARPAGARCDMGAFEGVVAGSADLAVGQTDTPDPLTAGATLTYAITVTNQGGPDAATAVMLTDVLPGGVTFVSATPSQGACSGTAPVTCAMGALAVNASATVTIVVGPLAAGTLSNTVTVGAFTADPSAGNNTATATTTVISAPPTAADLSLAVAAAPDPVTVGATLTYVLTVTNDGPDVAAGVTLTDALPGEVALVSATASQGTCSGTAPVTCTLGALLVNASATVTLEVTPTVAGALSNTASVITVSADPNPGNNSATASTTVNPAPTPTAADLALTGTDVPDPVTVGATLTYLLTVTNNGPDAAAGVTLTSVPPTGAILASATPTQGCCSGTTTLTCLLGSLASGASAAVRLVVIPTAAAVITHTASVAATTTDPDSSNNSLSSVTQVSPGATDLAITSPPNGSRFPVTGATPITFAWTPLAGVALYGFEFTAPNRLFTNPNGTGPDIINGFGGTGSGFAVAGTGFGAVVTSAFAPGIYQVRVVGLSPEGQLIGSFSDAVTLVLGESGAGACPVGERVTITIPASGTQVSRGALVAFAWTPLSGVVQYGFEYTGLNRLFLNPNGTAADGVNGFGGAGGGLLVSGTGFTTTISVSIEPGSYQVRVIGFSDGQPVGTFSDAVTLVVQ